MAYYCKPCGARFSTKPRRNEHERHCPMRIGEQWECTACDLTYADQKSRDRHENEKHLNPRIFQCPQCNCTCQRKDSLQDHMRHFHSGETSNSESAAMASTPTAVPAVAGGVASRKRVTSASKASTPQSKETTEAAGSFRVAKRIRSSTHDLSDHAPAAASSTTSLLNQYTPQDPHPDETSSVSPTPVSFTSSSSSIAPRGADMSTIQNPSPFETSSEPPRLAKLSLSSSFSSMAASWEPDIHMFQDLQSSEMSPVQLTPNPTFLPSSPIAWDLEPFLDIPEDRQLSETSFAPPPPVKLSSSSSSSSMAAFPWEATESDNKKA